MDDWSGFLTPALGTAGLLTLAIVLILRGALVPRSTLEMLRRDNEREVGIYRDIITARDETIKTQAEQINMLLEGNRTTLRVVESLPEAARLNREGGRDVLAPAPEA